MSSDMGSVSDPKKYHRTIAVCLYSLSMPRHVSAAEVGGEVQVRDWRLAGLMQRSRSGIVRHAGDVQRPPVRTVSVRQTE